MHVERITICPVVGLEPIGVEAARVLPSGALDHDRRWRLVDADGAALGGQALRRLDGVRAEYDLASRTITLSVAVGGGGAPVGACPETVSFPLRPGPDGPCPWLSRVTAIETFLQERADGGFPEDPDAPGPTVAASASLDALGRWFGLAPDAVRRRFRVGVEIAGCDAFWEDSLACPSRHSGPPVPDVPGDPGDDPWSAAPPPEPRSIVVGTARFLAVGVRELGDDEARDRATGIQTGHFREIFEAWRRRAGRADVDAGHWSHRYRFAATTVGDGQGGEMRVGDRCVPVAHLGRS